MAQKSHHGYRPARYINHLHPNLLQTSPRGDAFALCRQPISALSRPHFPPQPLSALPFAVASLTLCHNCRRLAMRRRRPFSLFFAASGATCCYQQPRCSLFTANDSLSAKGDLAVGLCLRHSGLSVTLNISFQKGSAAQQNMA